MTDQSSQGVQRRGFLALATGVVTAGCSSSAPLTPEDTTQASGPVGVDVGYWSAQKLSTEDYEPISGEFVYQIAVSLIEPSPELQKVEFSVFTGDGTLTTTWKLPEEKNEQRNLGENVYGETVHQGDLTFEPGDHWEARAFTSDAQRRVEAGRVPENGYESE